MFFRLWVFYFNYVFIIVFLESFFYILINTWCNYLTDVNNMDYIDMIPLAKLFKIYRTEL